MIREPNEKIRRFYDALKCKYVKLVKLKSVVHKSKLEDCQFIENQSFFSGIAAGWVKIYAYYNLFALHLL
jgi:hypothetical protein